jgi:hypothetical protein
LTIAPPSLAGELVEGRYRIEQAVGSGGFGTVYAAWHLLLDTRVALKVLSTPSSWSAEQRSSRIAMFLDEARTLAKLKHPNVIAALDAGILSSPRLAGPTPFLVMAWCGGGSMSDLFDRGPLPPDQVAALMGAVVDAIAYAHGQGVVHRDLKPSNVMFEGVPGSVVPRVIDFGIAKLVMPEEAAGDGETMTVSSSRMFTPAYAAPEQVAGAKTGPWTDVHALGLMIVHALVGRPPYGSESRMAAIDPERPTPKTFGFDAGQLEPILARALALKPAERFRDAGELAQVLSSVWPRPAAAASALRIDLPASSPVRLAPAPGYTSVTAPPASMTIGTGVAPPVAPVPPTVRTPRVGRRIAIAAGLAAGAALGIGAAVALAGRLGSGSPADRSAEDEEEDGATAPAPRNKKRKLSALTVTELADLARRAGYDVERELVTDEGQKLLEVEYPKDSNVRVSIQLLKLTGPEASRLADFGRLLLESRRAWWNTQAYAFDGEWGLMLLARSKEPLAPFDSMLEELEFTVRGDTIGGGDPAGVAGGTRVAPWSAKALGELTGDELISRLRSAGVSVVSGPMGDSGPLPLFFWVAIEKERGDLNLYRHGGRAALSDLKRKGKQFAFAREGDALLVLEGPGRLKSPDLLAQILKGLDAKVESEPPF